MPRVIPTAYYNNPFIGLYARASDRLTIMAGNCHAKLVDAAREALGTPVEKTFISESHLVGIYTAMNSNGVILPSTSKEEKLFKKHGLNVYKLDTYAPGNTIVCNDKACLTSTHIPSAAAKKIGDALGVEVFTQRFSGLGSAATTSALTNKGILAYNELTETELKHLAKMFGVYASVGTTNFGVPFNSLGIVANSNGALVGRDTTGYEMQRIYETLFG